MALTDTLEHAWYGQGRAPWWAAPLSALYGVVSGLRRMGYRHGVLRRVRLPVPVLVIGNLTAGGTGKTPLTITLVDALRQGGWPPGVVSRGYGGSQREPALLGEDADPAVFGDEPCLIRAQGVAVAVGRDRPAAAALLLGAGCDLIIADDGLQHYRLARDVEIVVIDGARRFGNGRLLPAGPLREPIRRLRTVDFCVCNGGRPHTGETPMRLVGGTARALIDGHSKPLSHFSGRRVRAIAAIGNPERFFDSLQGQGLLVEGRAFPDHHAYRPDELESGDDLPLLMTEKDAIKCARFARPHWWSVPVKAVLPDDFADAVHIRLQAARR